METRENLKNAKTIVVKIGTSSLAYAKGGINYERMERLSMVLSNIKNSGKKVILVTSGAVGVGSGILGWDKRPEKTKDKQAAAAVGQAVLMKIYQKFFSEFNQTLAQILLTKDGIEDPTRRNNAYNTIGRLLELGVIPIINENDTVSTDEIEFGDNDTLSANVAALMKADLLVILSDIDGLYTSNPNKDPNARRISTVYEITEDIENAAGTSDSTFGKGGMITKITAAKTCTQAGVNMVIANGKDVTILFDILAGKEIGTLFLGQPKSEFIEAVAECCEMEN
jgi:glutamate 5-kinase